MLGSLPGTVPGAASFLDASAYSSINSLVTFTGEIRMKSQAWGKSIRILGAALFALAVVGIAGCGGSTGTVKGEVTFQGKKIPIGDVSIVCKKDAKRFTGSIENGVFSIDGVYIGDAEIQVIPRKPAPGSKMKAMEMEDKFKKKMEEGAERAKDEAEKWKSSGLDPNQVPVNFTKKISVKSGTNTVDMKLDEAAK
jgi:hypothetical protein